MIDFRHKPTPYRLVEAVTSLCLPVGHLYAGGAVWTPISLFYAMHFVASFSFHMWPSTMTYRWDTSMINLAWMESCHLLWPNPWIYVLCLGSIMFCKDQTHLAVMYRIVASVSLLLIFLPERIPFLFMYLCAIVLLFFMISTKAQEDNELLLSSLLCALYHIYLGFLSYTEESLMFHKNVQPHFVQYFTYFVFAAHTTLNFTRDPKRMRSILSLISAIGLAPCAMNQMIHQLQTPGTAPHQDSAQVPMILFYVAYVLADTIFGLCCYPDYFPLLEGWVHHIGTFLACLYYLWHPNMRINMCTGMIIETSSILLFSSRVLYDSKKVQKLTRLLFPDMFLLFRIIIPTLWVIHYFFLLDAFSWLVFSITMGLNIYWFLRLS